MQKCSEEDLHMHSQPESGAVQTRLTGSELAALDDWRRGQEKIPPRAEALREAIRRLVTPPAGALPPSRRYINGDRA
jgi:hypothetical protein